MLPVPLSRMLAACAGSRRTRPNIGAVTFRPVTNPVERLDRQVKRRADVAGIFPNEPSRPRLTGAVPFGRNREWQTAA